MKITQLETFLIAPRWLFLRVHTDEGIVGLGEPYLEGRATTSAVVIASITILIADFFLTKALLIL